MRENWKSISWDLRALIIVAIILFILIFSSIISPNKEDSFASPLVFLTIGVISIILAIKPILQDSTKSLALTIIGSFSGGLLLLILLPINIDYWSEIISLFGIFLAVCVTIIKHLILLNQENQYDFANQKDIRIRMLNWSKTDKFAHLTEKEAYEIRQFLDIHNID